jgi:hypothetical protein
MSTDDTKVNYRYDIGIGNVGSYQVAGRPFVTGGIDATHQTYHTRGGYSLDFPYVTRWVTVANHDTNRDLKIAFSKNGLAGTNWFRIGSGSNQSVRLELKVQELWFTGSDSFDVIAGLTGIDTARINNLSPSGSNWSGSLDAKLELTAGAGTSTDGIG